VQAAIDPDNSLRVLASANDYRCGLCPYVYLSTNSGTNWTNYPVPGAGGLAYGEVKTNLTGYFLAPAVLINQTISNTKTGYTVGGGIESPFLGLFSALGSSATLLWSAGYARKSCRTTRNT